MSETFYIASGELHSIPATLYTSAADAYLEALALRYGGSYAYRRDQRGFVQICEATRPVFHGCSLDSDDEAAIALADLRGLKHDEEK